MTTTLLRLCTILLFTGIGLYLLLTHDLVMGCVMYTSWVVTGFLIAEPWKDPRLNT